MSGKASLRVVALAAAMLAALSFVPLVLPWQAAAADSSAEQKGVEYTCPMHPEVRSKTPGSCPKCGMHLVAVHEDPKPSESSSPWGANYFPNVPLTTQDGKTVHLYDDLLKDKIVAIDLIYTQCHDSCPLETARLAQVQRMLGDRVGKDIFFYSISIDPAHDTPAALKQYADKFHANWTFLTGKPEDIELASKKLGLYSPDWNRDGHLPTLLLGDVAKGQWMRHSAMDNARFLVIQIEQFLNTWAARKPAPVKNYGSAGTIAIKSPGQYLFFSRCVACHSIGKGDEVGPDLLGVTERRDREWLEKFIGKPDVMLSSSDPVAAALFKKYQNVRMPNLRLSPEDVDALIEYLQSRGATMQQSKETQR